jgi:hypothetical protein
MKELSGADTRDVDQRGVSVALVSVVISSFGKASGRQTFILYLLPINHRLPEFAEARSKMRRGVSE